MNTERIKAKKHAERRDRMREHMTAASRGAVIQLRKRRIDAGALLGYLDKELGATTDRMKDARSERAQGQVQGTRTALLGLRDTLRLGDFHLPETEG
ncbi:MAG: hypothetical protein Alpg2KO_01190 [Alphaproteobacteria bacterium]